MKPVLFSIQRVNRLRQAAEKARKNAGMGWDGWSDDTHTAMELLRVFDALWLKEGFTLEAYVYSSCLPAITVMVSSGQFPRMPKYHRLRIVQE